MSSSDSDPQDPSPEDPSPEDPAPESLDDIEPQTAGHEPLDEPGSSFDFSNLDTDFLISQFGGPSSDATGGVFSAFTNEDPGPTDPFIDESTENSFSDSPTPAPTPTPAPQPPAPGTPPPGAILVPEPQVGPNPDRVDASKIPIPGIPAGPYVHSVVTRAGVTYDAYYSDTALHNQTWLVPVGAATSTATASALTAPAPQRDVQPPARAPNRSVSTPPPSPIDRDGRFTGLDPAGAGRLASAMAMASRATRGAPLQRVESTGAWLASKPSATVRRAIEEQARYGFRLAGEPTRMHAAVSASPRTRALSIAEQMRGPSANIAEITAYEARLSRGEIGIKAPKGALKRGVDYVTAQRRWNGSYKIVPVDAKSTRVDPGFLRGRIEPMKPTWVRQVDDAMRNLSLGDPKAERAIRTAWERQRSTASVVRDSVDASPKGQGRLLLDGKPYSRPTASIGGRVVGGVLGAVGVGLAGYAFQQNLANGQWFDAAVDATGFVSSALTVGAAIADSAALAAGGEVIGAFGVGVLAGAALDHSMRFATTSVLGVDLSPSAQINRVLTGVDQVVTGVFGSLWSTPAEPAYTQTIGWKLANLFD